MCDFVEYGTGWDHVEMGCVCSQSQVLSQIITKKDNREPCHLYSSGKSDFTVLKMML